jgi:hypothetical protein
MLYRHEKPRFKKETQTIFEPSFPTTISQIQCFLADGLRVPLKCTHGFAYQTWNFPIPSHTFRCFRFVSSRYDYETFFSWVDHEIPDLLIDPSFLSYSLFPFMRLRKNSQRKKIKLFMVMSRINLFRKDDLGELVKIIEDHCDPSLFSYLGISGSRFL